MSIAIDSQVVNDSEVVSLDLSRRAVIDKIDQELIAPIKRILLIHPPQFPLESLNVEVAKNRRYYAYPPYGLGLLCTNLKKRGYSVSILDLNFDLLEFLHKQVETDDAAVKVKLDLLWKEKVKTAISDFRPDVAGISCMFTMSHEITKQVADFIKAKHGSLPILAGGVHITNAPEIVLKECTGIDFVSLFEGDSSFPNLLDYANTKENPEALSQIGTLIDGNYIALKDRHVPTVVDMDTRPDYLDLRIGDYHSLGEIGNFRYWLPEDSRNSSVLSNRGCRARCSFCSVRNFNGLGVRTRSIESVVDEIEELKLKHGISHISWLDDDLFYDPKRTVSLYNEIIRRKLGITWDAMNGIIASAIAVHPETLHSAAESGCIAANIGVESGNEEILKRVHKPSGIRHFLKVGEIMRQYPQIFVRAFIIVGFPGETLGMILDTINLCIQMGLDWNAIQKLTPLPSTEIYDQMVGEGRIKKGSLNTDGGYSLFAVREGERQRVREQNERLNAKQFIDYFKGNLNHVPTMEELDDIWLIMDYKVNYDKILNEQNHFKLKKMQQFLGNVCARMSVNNPLATLFLGITEKKLGLQKESQDHFAAARQLLAGSDYWQKRFEVLGLDDSYMELT